VRFGAAAARWCGVGAQVAAVVGAEVVVARGGFSADDTVVPPAVGPPALWL
jgi:hypothetical protein